MNRKLWSIQEAFAVNFRVKLSSDFSNINNINLIAFAEHIPFFINYQLSFKVSSHINLCWL